MNRLIFLDIDGVLNDHAHYPNGYCGAKPECVEQFNRLLAAAPDARIVISSAWRYHVHNGEMTVKGIESMLLCLGVDCFGRVDGVTVTDEAICGDSRDYAYLEQFGADIRCKQICTYVVQSNCDAFVVLDDLYMNMKSQIHTDGKIGLTAANTDQAHAILENGTHDIR